MKTNVEHIFKLSKASLIEHYSSKALYENRFKQDGVDNYNFTRFENDAAHCLIEVSRQVDIQSDKLPKLLKKVVDNLGSSAKVITEIQWDKKKAQGSYKIFAHGMPVHSNIRFQIIEKSAQQCVVKAELDINAKIPIVGKQLEKFMLPKAEKALKRDLEKTAAYLESL